MLPIVQRELQTAARNPKLYRKRTLTGLIVVVIVVFAAFNPSDPRRLRGVGTFFETFSFIAFLLCLFDGIRKTSDSIASERREGTLGLLFLSTLSGLDIVLGKLAAATVRSLSTLLAFIPVLAISLLVGGTTAGEFWRTILVLILGLLLSLSLCLCVSTLTREGSLPLCIFLLFFLAVGPFAGFLAGYEGTRWIVPASPLYTLRSSFEAFYSFDSHRYWVGVAYLVALILSSVALAAFILPRAWQDRPFISRTVSVAATPSRPAAHRRSMLDHNPVMWLMFNPRSHQQSRKFLYAIVLVVVLASAVILYIAQGVIDAEFALISPIVGLAAIVLVSTLRVARATTQNFAEARSNGALELMLSTPLKVQDILNGQWLALRADLQPAALVAAGLSLLVLILPIALGELAPLFWIVKSMLEAAMGIATVAVFGVWMGLTSKTSGRAFFKTVALAFVAPYAILCIPTLVIQLVLMLLALDKVHVHFRRFVAERYLANPSLLTAVASSGPNTPPVIRK